MSFEYPSFLWAAFAVLIPILIHLFNLKRPKKVFFSNVRFLKNIEEKSSKKIKFRHWLILLSRVLFTLFLVFAFAKPFLPVENISETKGTNAYSFYIDNSPSMSISYDDAISMFDKSIIELEKIIQSIPKDSRINIVTNQLSGTSLSYFNRQDVVSRLRQVAVSNAMAKPKVIYKRQRDALKNIKSLEGNFFWVSDFQKNQFQTLKEMQLEKNAPTLIKVNAVSRSNLYVDSVYLDKPFIQEGAPVDLMVVIKNSGDQDMESKLTLTNDESQLGFESFDISANASKTIKLSLVFQEKGLNKCKLSLNDPNVIFDNEFFLVIEVGMKINVYELYEPGNTGFQAIYKNESSFQYTGNEIGEVDFSKIDASNLLILNEVSELTSGTIQHIREYAESGGNVLIVPKSGATDILGDFGLNYTVNKDTSRQKVAYPSGNDPFFSDVFMDVGTNEDFTMPDCKPIVTFNRGGRNLLKTSLGDPFLVSKPFAKGNIYASCSPWNPEYSSIRAHGFIVPLLYKLAMNSAEMQPLYSLFDSEYIYNFGDVKIDQVKLKGGATEIIPRFRQLGNKMMLEVPENLVNPGHYEVIAGDSAYGVIAVNFNQKESILKYLDTGELKNQGYKVIETGDSINFSSTFSEKNFGVHLWKYCILISLIFLAIEIILIRIL